MKTILFTYPHERCPNCHARLKVYRKIRRKVKLVNWEFTAIHRIKICPADRTIFRSDELDKIVSPHCIYANDIMVESSIQRFINGRSSSEISSSLGVSEGHVRKLSNQGLNVFGKLHEKHVSQLREHIRSYVVQIDGTTDSEFSMIVVVRDALSDFTLYARKCPSESQEAIEDILNEIDKRFGKPSGITCDMRSGIISAAQSVFPNTPIRICLMHFLRDLGKDLMKNMHTDLGIMINRKGIKSPLKKILGDMPDYRQSTLEEIEYDFCTKIQDMEIMSVRRILEKVVYVGGSSGYGFPFTLKHINFFNACSNAVKELTELMKTFSEKGVIDTAASVVNHIKKITENSALVSIAGKLGDINSFIFQAIRKAFIIPRHGNLSYDEYDPHRDDPAVHEKCTVIFGELKVYTGTNIPKHLIAAAKLAVERYEKREEMLFSQNTDGTIPRTNNGMERFFRKIRRNIRKRSGNNATGTILAQSGDKLALFQNMSSPEYRKIVFGNADIGSVFSSYREPFKKIGMTKKRTLELVDKGKDMILAGNISRTPY